MFGIGGFELFLILLFGFLIFGPDKLPAMAKTLGKAIAKFRSAQEEMSGVLKGEMVFDKDSDEPFKNPLDALDDVAAKASKGTAAAKKAATTASKKVGEAAKKTGTTTAAAGAAAAAAAKAEVADGEAAPAKPESCAERKARYDKERQAKKEAEAEERKAKEAEEKKAAAEARKAEAAKKREEAAAKRKAEAEAKKVAEDAKTVTEAADAAPAADTPAAEKKEN